MAAGEGGAPTREGGRRPGRRSAVLVAVAVVGCVVAAALAYSTITRPTTDPRIDIAAGQAVAVAEDVTTTLTTEAEDRRYLDDDLFESEMVAFVDERVGDALVEQGDGRVVWSKFILASADNLAGGWLATSFYAVLCVEVTVDRHATPLVRMVDARCDPEQARLYPDAFDVDLLSPWPPERSET